MDQIPHRDQPLERTAKTTAKAGLKPWDLKQYEYKEPKGDHRLPHGDPRTEAPQSYDRHQEQFDCDFPSSDTDHRYGHPVSSNGFTPLLDASASFVSDQGTLAGGGFCSKLLVEDSDDGITTQFEKQKNTGKRVNSEQQRQREADAIYNHRIAEGAYENEQNDNTNRRYNSLRDSISRD